MSKTNAPQATTWVIFKKFSQKKQKNIQAAQIIKANKNLFSWILFHRA